jgi:hypothetical protein
MNAWLVTWEWMGEHAKVDNPLVAILDRRLGYARVAEFVRLTWASAMLTPEELIAGARARRFPYEPRRGARGGIPIDFEMDCGHNPFLFARLVRNIRIESDDDGARVLRWERWTWPREAYERLGIPPEEETTLSLRLS